MIGETGIYVFDLKGLQSPKMWSLYRTQHTKFYYVIDTFTFVWMWMGITCSWYIVLIFFFLAKKDVRFW